MRRVKQAFLGVGLLAATGLIVWPGCATPPLPSKREPIAMRKAADFKPSRSGPTTRAELIDRMGEPDRYLADLRIACYRINKVTKRNLWLLFLVIPINVEKRPGYVEVAFVRFDEADRITHAGRKIISSGIPRPPWPMPANSGRITEPSLEKAALQWWEEERPRADKRIDKMD